MPCPMTRSELVEHYQKNVLPCCPTAQHFYPEMCQGEAFEAFIDAIVAFFGGNAHSLTDSQVEVRFVSFMAGWKAGRDTCGVDHERFG